MYYINVIEEDGRPESKEVACGHIYCKCIMCGKEFEPSQIDFNQQYLSTTALMFWNCCPHCFEVYQEQEQWQKTYGTLSQTLSLVLGKEITAAEAYSFIISKKEAQEDMLEAARKYFKEFSV